MKKIVVLALALVAAACSRKVEVGSPSPSDASRPGAADGRTALTAFMAAARAQDIQAMGRVWGSAAGPARETLARDGMDAMEKRVLTMMCFLKHDRYTVLADAPSPGGRRTYSVQVTYGDLTRTSNFNAVAGPSGRWYIESFETEPLQPICAHRG